MLKSSKRHYTNSSPQFSGDCAVSLAILKQKLEKIGAESRSFSYGLIDQSAKSIVLDNIDQCLILPSPVSFSAEIMTALKAAGVKAQIILVQNKQLVYEFVFISKNKIFEFSSYGDFLSDYKNKIVEISQDA